MIQKIFYRIVSVVLVVVFSLALTYSEAVRTDVYAYATESHFYVADGNSIIASEKISFNSDYSRIIWSLDGRYAVIIADSHESPGELNQRVLVSIDSLTGKTVSDPCPGCQSIAPINDSEVVITRVDPMKWEPAPVVGILLKDLSVEGLPSLVPLSDHPKDEFREMEEFADYVFTYEDLAWEYSDIFFSGGFGDAAVMSNPGVGEGNFLYLQPEAEVILQEVEIADFVSNSGPKFLHDKVGHWGHPWIDRSLPAGDENGNLVIAAVVRYETFDEECPMADDVYMIRPATGEVTRTNISFTYPDLLIPGVSVALAVEDIWWDESGQLRTIISSSVCSDPQVQLLEPNEWKLENNEWVLVSNEPVLSVRRGDYSTLKIVIEKFDDPSGSLLLESRSGTSVVDSGVVALEVPNGGACISYSHVSSDGWCGGAGQHEYQSFGTERETLFFDIEGNGNSLDAGEVVQSACSADDFSEALRDMSYDLPYESVEPICRNGFAYVHLQGSGPWVYEGTQDLLFIDSDKGWILLAGGATSSGKFVGVDLEYAGIYPDRIRELFPEMDII